MKWLLGSVGLIIGLALLWVGWSRLEYGPNPPIAHHRISISLPYSPENEATHMIAMGETIAHPIKGGHPGIDFQWDHSVPLIAVSDGKITSIKKADDMGESVLYVSLKTGGYLITYKELEKTAEGIQKDSIVKQGQVIGYPHCTVHTDQNGNKNTGCQVHWEFGYDTFPPSERLCPLTYFDSDARNRIEKLWASVPDNDRFKQNAPNICSNIYANRDQ